MTLQESRKENNVGEGPSQEGSGADLAKAPRIPATVTMNPAALKVLGLENAQFSQTRIVNVLEQNPSVNGILDALGAKQEDRRSKLVVRVGGQVIHDWNAHQTDLHNVEIATLVAGGSDREATKPL